MPLRFPGTYADRETGTLYNWHRDLDPATGRFIEADPMGLESGLNPFSYVDNDPLSYIDDAGLAKKKPRGPSSQPPASPPSTASIGRGISPPVVGTGVPRALDIPMLGGASRAGARLLCPAPAESPIWKGLGNYRGPIKTNNESGKKRQYYTWHYTHGDIEVYDRNGKHLGSMNSITGDMYKPAIPGRALDNL